ncbi:hypothetical protein BJ684DRAFT_7578 [Piptocephalis cylindrospora]|uniref:Octanoyltransferase n=1 Tax=Piptocephalis cylindrospora TaxID=1907219 RepID=A0A4P9Y7M5_9FUNG|nr:hypothetical protein BJ684DRAFT_7578 [Piptocephalis cylindrospora]|eukprot:RKP15088.1 hypothetical protein BJ684DRAFT_7578 [Piptocephalis cylindrospora]
MSRLAYKYIPLVSYTKALRLQEALVTRRIERIKAGGAEMGTDLLLLLQHPPTYTTGRRFLGKTDPEEKRRLESLGAEFIETPRGGLTTFHGPGQLVGYPILSLPSYKLGVRAYVEKVEQVLIDVCSDFKIKASTSPDTGVWVKEDKVAAMGIQVRRHVTSHGFALNCNVDLGWYNHIVPCGLVGKGVTSLTKEIMKRDGDEGAQVIQVDQALPKVLSRFGQHFGQKILAVSDVDPSLDAFTEEVL